MDEEGVRDRRTRLLEQRRRAEHRIRIEKQAIPTPTEPDPPPPGGHPIISEDSFADDDDGDDDPDNDASSADDSPLIFEPEGDVWADHGGNDGGLVSDDNSSHRDASHSTPSQSIQDSSKSSDSIPSVPSSHKKVNWKDKVIDKPSETVIWSIGGAFRITLSCPCG